jgi:hypothetical protein
MSRKFVNDSVAQAIGIKQDGAESVFVERQLLTLRSKLYEVKRGPYQARVLFPVSNEDDPGAKTIAYQIMDSVGVAKLVADYAKDFPRVDVFIREEYAKVKSIGDSYGISVDELRSAAFAKRPLQTMKASAAKKAIDQEFERIALLGDTANNMVGAFAIPNASIYTVPNGAGASALWANKTPDEILADLNGMVARVRTTTNDNEYIDTIALPIAQHNLIKTKARSATGDTTILEFFQNNNPGVQVVAVPRLSGKGAGATDRMMGYRRDPDVIELANPLEFEQSAPQMEGREMVTYCEMKTAGVICRLPLAVIYGDGI